MYIQLYINKYKYICIYIHVFIHVHMYTYICTCIYTHAKCIYILHTYIQNAHIIVGGLAGFLDVQFLVASGDDNDDDNDVDEDIDDADDNVELDVEEGIVELELEPPPPPRLLKLQQYNTLSLLTFSLEH